MKLHIINTVESGRHLRECPQCSEPRRQFTYHLNIRGNEATFSVVRDLRLRTRLTWLWYDLLYAIIWIRYGFRDPSLEELLTQDEITRLRALIQEGF